MTILTKQQIIESTKHSYALVSKILRHIEPIEVILIRGKMYPKYSLEEFNNTLQAYFYDGIRAKHPNFQPRQPTLTM